MNAARSSSSHRPGDDSAIAADPGSAAAQPSNDRAPGAVSRRDFLRRGAAGLAAAASAPVSLTCFTPGEHAGAVAAAVAPGRACGPTEDDIEGPFYRPGAPFRADLVTGGLSGKRLVLAGQVRGPDCRPLAGALLDFWQADARGRYDNDDPDRPPPPDLFVLRGRQRTGASGRWELRTIFPGHYRIGPKQWRPAHIHVKASGPGTATLTTQLYFAGDPHFAADPFWHPSLVIAVDDTAKDAPRGRFDFQLR